MKICERAVWPLLTQSSWKCIVIAQAEIAYKMGWMALTQAVRIRYMTMSLSICLQCVNASTIWPTILLSRNYVMQPRDDKQDNTNQTVHTQLQFINIQY